MLKFYLNVIHISTSKLSWLEKDRDGRYFFIEHLSLELLFEEFM